MNLWDDPRIVLEAAECAITLFVHAANGEKLELNKARAMFANIANVLARCYVRSIEANVEKEIEEKKKESEGYYDDPNM